MLKLKVSKMCTLILCGLIFLLVTQPIFKSVRFYSVCLTVTCMCIKYAQEPEEGARSLETGVMREGDLP